MYKKKRILGLIPARGGSKGLPGKNILPLVGRPLIAWTIEQALKSCYLDRVIVSTDDKEIADVSKKYGAEVPFMRPEDLARDMTPTIDVITHALHFLEEQNELFDYIILLEPTSPLRKEDDIDSAIKQLIAQENHADSLVSVGEVHLEHPSIIKTITNLYVKSYVDDVKMVSRRQDLDKAFFPYGVVYLSKVDKLISNRTFYMERTIPYVIERWQNYEIDDVYDLLCIEAILNYKLKSCGMMSSKKRKQNSLHL